MASNDYLERMIARAADGGRAAFCRLYEATAGKLLAVSLAILDRPEVAEEALQDGFLNS